MKKNLQLIVAILILTFSSSGSFGQCSIINSSFEDWQIDTSFAQNDDTIFYEYPIEWLSLVDFFRLSLGPISADFVPVVNKTTEVYAGAYALRLDAEPDEDGDIIAMGPCDTKPSYFNGYFKYNGESVDTFIATAFMIKGDPFDFLFADDTSLAIGSGVFIFTGSNSSYQPFSVKINYKPGNDPDTFVIFIVNKNWSAASDKTSLFLDEISISNTSSIHREDRSMVLQVYPNPSDKNLTIDLGSSYSEIEVIVRNTLGQEVSRQIFHNSTRVQYSIEGDAGVYFIEVNADKMMNFLKVIIK